jgi:predicted nucleic acid-binding protein
MLRLYDVIVPKAVADEIMRPDPMYPQRVYPDRALFEQMLPQMNGTPEDEPTPLRLFGPGEAAAIPLAQRLDCRVLINDRRAAAFARNLGLIVLTVPDVIVVVRSWELLPDHVARALLQAGERHGTSPILVAGAMRALDVMSDG